jgi:hypothetical protein
MTAQGQAAFAEVLEFLQHHPWLRDDHASNKGYQLALACRGGFFFESDDPSSICFTGANLIELLSLARDQDRFAHRALLEIARDLTRRKQSLPFDLQAYVVALFDKPFVARKGPHPVSDAHRDDAIFHAVEIATRAGFRPSRNREGTNGSQGIDSACSLVARALNQCGKPMQENNVERAWRTQKLAREEAAAAGRALFGSVTEDTD